MEYVTLGRTGLSVSRMGLRCGGPSRLGLAQNKGTENVIAVIHKALDLGVNFVDTAEAYGNEDVVGQALASGGRRDRVVLSTKVSLRERNGDKNELRRPERLRERAEAGLLRLQTDRVDILHLHAVALADYPYVVRELVPVLRALQREGKIRFLGITEAFAPDPSHQTLRHALENDADDHWDVMMVGFNLINQSARETVLPLTQKKGIGTLNMFAVRRALSDEDKLRELMADLVARNLIKPDAFDSPAPLGFLLSLGADGSPPAAASIPEAAYRFCRDEPGLHVILSGTGNLTHLEENARALSAPPLPAWATNRLRALFAGVASVSGN